MLVHYIESRTAAYLVDFGARFVEEFSVCAHQVEISQHLVQSRVLVALQLASDSSQIHRLLDDLVILGKALNKNFINNFNRFEVF